MNLFLPKNLKFVFILLPVFLISCGEVIGSREFSTVNTTQIAWRNVVNVNASNISSFPLNGTCTVEAGTVTVSVGNPVLTTVTLPCIDMRFTGTKDLSAVGLAQGPTDLLATQSVLSADAITNLMVDTVVPLAPVIITPANGSTFGSVSQIISGTCETGSSVKITGDLVGSPISTSCSGGTFSRAINLISGDGSKTLVAAQMDSAGNLSPTDSVTITLNSLLPLAPVITAPTNGTLTNATALNVVGTCETNATVNISGNILASPVSVLCVAGNYNQPVTLTAADGAKSISVNQTNVTGTSPSVSVNITLDTTAPLAPTISSPTNGSLTNLTAQTIIGACETGATVNISGAIVGSPVTAVCVGSTYSRAVTLTAGDGAKAIAAIQTDVAGNTSPAANISITLDTLAPAAPTITSPTNGSSTNLTAQTIIGACETGATVNISGAIVGSPVTAVCVGSAYSRAVTLTAANGAKAISATQTDVAGNTSPATNISITLDTLAPTAPTITSPANGSSTNLTAQTVIGACETGATVNISGAIVGSPVTSVCVGSAYSRAVTLTAGDGAKAISATQTDVAGNISPAANISITLDTSAPLAPSITSPTNGSSTNLTAQTIIGACETGATVNISGAIVGSPVTAVCVGSAYSRAVTLTAGDGSKAISATQTDVAGNISPATNISITLDTVVPSVVITSSSGSPTSTTPIPFTVTFSESVTGFVSTDITVVNGSVTNFLGGPSVYTIEVTPAGAGVVSVSVAASRAQDGANNNNSASNTMNITYSIIPPNAFVTEWTIPANNTAVSLPLASGNIFNFTIDWGDGSPITTITSNVDPDKDHTYVTAGIYTVTMTGVIESYGVITPPTCRITNVIQMGYTGWKNLTWAFKYCDGLVNINVNDGTEFSNVTSMVGMFYGTDNANPDVSNWDVSNVTNFSRMFQLSSSANPDVSLWDVSSATNMFLMFENASAANPNVSNWDVSNVTNMVGMFRDADMANPDVSLWNVSSVQDMRDMFYGTAIANPNTALWNTSSVTNMGGMFKNAVSANPNVTNWNVSSVTNMGSMFAGAVTANPNVSLWNVSSVTDMNYMFASAIVANPTVTNWNVSSVTSMDSLFRNAVNANPNVSLWNTSNVTNMEYTFSGIAGNPNVTNFNVSNVTNFASMFRYCGSCNPNTSSWVISSGTNLAEMFDGAGIDNLNYTNFLIMADATSPFNGINVGLIPAKYQPAGLAARTNLLGPRAWTFTDNGAE